jgi:hypothetical protein
VVADSVRAKQLVPILAEKFGVPYETAEVIDRALADNGLRAKGKGRSWPEMSRREAVHFLIGCMTATTVKQAVATRAAVEVSRWLSASAAIEVKLDDTDLMAAHMIDTDSDDFEPTIIDDRSERLPFLKELDGQWISLVDYLLHIMHDEFSMEDHDTISLSLSPSHLEASICFWRRKWNGIGDERHLVDRQVFYAEGAEDIEPDYRIRTDVSVSGRFLWEIAIRTEDPLAEARLK